ncbi:DNA cytosine methyltransferase [Runella sp.]|uniref:DNA cytosine methyltransferase n=1 Tax=Runella sp. TaxID=1960881 RepID=UPI003D09AEE6
MLILSTFPGIDLLGEGFRENGFCVVQSGDIILGKDIRNFKSIKGKFDGIIGGSPCQDFSLARRTPPSGYGIQMLKEFKRIVIESDVDWFLLENVPNVPRISIDGYQMQRFFLNANECGSTQNRHRYFQFGSKAGIVLDIPRLPKPTRSEKCVMATEGNKTDRRTWEEFCALQGITEPFDLPDLTKAGAYKVVGNAVNLHVSRTIAAAIRRALASPTYLSDVRTCACGCGRIIPENRITATDACRKRVSVSRRIIPCVIQ